MFFEEISLSTPHFHLQLDAWNLVTWPQQAARKLVQLCI